MDQNLHDILHLKEKLNKLMIECFKVSREIDKVLDRMVKNENNLGNNISRNTNLDLY